MIKKLFLLFLCLAISRSQKYDAMHLYINTTMFQTGERTWVKSVIIKVHAIYLHTLCAKLLHAKKEESPTSRTKLRQPGCLYRYVNIAPFTQV